MIPFASQRGGGQDLATHLLNEYDNDIATLDTVRGAIAEDLHGAFKEWEAQAAGLTKCREYLYSLSINPDPAQGPLTRAQYMDYAARVEAALGLEDQPRAVVFHTKFGREHCHIVWSRIDVEREKAVHLAFDREALMHVTKAFARDHGLRLPPGYERSRGRDQTSLYEKEQERRTGFTKDDHKAAVTEAWHMSDSASAFVQALSERGYILAKGRRPYVLVDLYGHENALAKLIDDPGVRTKDLRAFLEKDFPPDVLPTVDHAKALIERHRALLERSTRVDRANEARTQLSHAQAERRRSLALQRAALQAKHASAEQNLAQTQKAVRARMRAQHQMALHDARARRAETRPTGLAAFLGRVTGIERIRAARHRRQDHAQIRDARQEEAALRARQSIEAQRERARRDLESGELARQQRALLRIDRRELAALLRDQRAEERKAARSEGLLPSLAQVHRALETNHHPDLAHDFADAAGGRREREADDDRQRPHPSVHDDRDRDDDHDHRGPQR